jgi:uncharacterized metal-binding protein YceD (DUF177 family)
MNTRPQETLSYRDLARQQARISRQVSLAELPRIKALVDALVTETLPAAVPESGRAGFDVVLQFSVDSRGFSHVEGGLSGQIILNCNGCAELLPHPLELSFACVIAESESIADGLVEDSRAGGETQLAEDVLVANGTEVTVAQIVEDEILLNLPERLCTSDPCERAPVLAYPADKADEAANAAQIGQSGGQFDGPAESDENPFSVLAELKVGSRRKDD